MTIKGFKYLLTLFIILFCGPELPGQVKDFQSWWKLEFTREINPKLDLYGQLEQRFKNNSLQYSRSQVTLGASYNPSNYFRLAGGTRIIFLMDGENRFHTRYRIHLDGIGRYELSGFDLSLRCRLQYGFDDILAFRYFRMNALVNRYRLRVGRHIFGTRFGWYAAAESWHGSNNESRWQTYAMRYMAEVRFIPTFKSRFSLRYMLEDEFNVVRPRQLHVLVLGYNYRF
jgi:hypothetical protein